MGLRDEDADDVAAQAVLCTLERLADVENVQAFALDIAKKLASRFLGGARAMRGLVVPLPRGADVDALTTEDVPPERRLEAIETTDKIVLVAREAWVATAVNGEGSAKRMARKRVRDALEGCA